MGLENAGGRRNRNPAASAHPAGAPAMSSLFEYQCCECGRRYARDQVTYLCPVCSATYRPGMPLKGVLRVEFDYESIRRGLNPRRIDYTLWNAVEEDYFPPCAVGNTPFTRIDRFGALAGFANLWAKNDGLNPSGSLKDRASFLVAAEARRRTAPPFWSRPRPGALEPAPSSPPRPATPPPPWPPSAPRRAWNASSSSRPRPPGPSWSRC